MRVYARAREIASDMGTVLAPNKIVIIDRMTVSQKELLKDTSVIIILDVEAVKLIHFNEMGLRAIIKIDEFSHHRSGRFFGVSPG